jgi:hypothetical protein
LATIKALSSYKHADHFNKRVVKKASHDIDEDTKETASVVKQIQSTKEV